MRILLVEDENFKKELIESELASFLVAVDMHYARSVQHAVSAIEKILFDLIILDIALPSHALRAGGSQPLSQPSGGVEVLLELSYDKREDKVIILTQHPEIEFDGCSYSLDTIAEVFSNRLCVNIGGIIHFHPSDEIWKSKLRENIL